MNHFFVYIFNFAIFFLVSSCYASEKEALIVRSNMSILRIPHPQHKQYNVHDLLTTVTNGFDNGEQAYEADKYSEAAMFASGALGYLDVMRSELGNSGKNAISQNTIDIAHYILADCHLNHLKSPQRALDSVRHIHDQAICFGDKKCIITSKMAAEALREKASQCVHNKNNGLALRLESEANFYDNKQKQILYNQYFDAISQHRSELQQIMYNKLTQIKDKQAPLRRAILPLLLTPMDSRNSRNISVANLFALELISNFNDIISAFISCDGAYIIPFLEEKSDELASIHNQTTTHIKNYIHYTLGLLYYHQGNYKKSFVHFTQTKEYVTDLSTQCKVLQCFNQLHTTVSDKAVAEAIIIIQKLFSRKTVTPRNDNATAERPKLLSCCAYNYAQKAIEYEQYKNAFYLADVCLRSDETYSIGVDILVSLQKTPYGAHNVTTSNTLSTVVSHFKQHDDEESLAYLSTIFSQHVLCQKTFNPKTPHIEAHYLEYALDNNHGYTKEEKHRLRQLCADAYYLKSKALKNKEQKIKYLKKAARFNKHEAIIDLGFIIMDDSKTVSAIKFGVIMSKIELLAHDPAVSPRIRAKALEILAKVGMATFINEKQILFALPYERKTIMDYLQAAYILGEKESSDITIKKLARYYMQGIEGEKPGEWLVAPDHDKARQMLEELSKKDKSIAVQSLLAQSCYACGTEYYAKASNLFSAVIKQIEALPQAEQTIAKYVEEKYLACRYMSILKLQNLNPKNILEACHYYYKTVALDPGFIMSFNKAIDNNTYQLLEQYTNKMMKQKNTQEHAVALCGLVGLFFSDEIYDNSADNLALQTKKAHALQCLQYAADNNHCFAQITIISDCESKISNTHAWVKLKYAKKVAEHFTTKDRNKMLAYLSVGGYKTLQETIAAGLSLYRVQIWKNKYDCILYLKQTNEKELEEYLASVDFASIPKCATPLFTTSDEQLAQNFYTDTILRPYITEFDTLYEKNSSSFPVTPVNVMLNYIYALMNSSDPTILKVCVSYATKLLELKAFKESPEVKHILAVCRGKLG